LVSAQLTRSEQAAVDVAMQSFSRLDAVILNAGALGPIGTTASQAGKLEAYKALFDINFFSLVSILTHAIPFLNASDSKPSTGDNISGRVILVSSGAATGGTPAWGAYSASKASMNSLGRTLAQEEEKIVTVAVRPGTVQTVMQAEIRSTGGFPPSSRDEK
jgi:NAD(P)-dependent dehydrogenase (short-subunit alcohol dehydrogenase family)